MEFVNGQATPVTSVALRFNLNTFGLQPADVTVTAPTPVAPGTTGRASAIVTLSPAHVKKGSPPDLNVEAAMRDNTSGAVLKFVIKIPFQVLFVEDGEVPQASFIEQWQTIPEENELETTLSGVVSTNLADASAGLASVQAKLSKNNVFYIAQRRLEDGQIKVYCSLKTATGLPVMLELTFKNGFDLCKLCLKSRQPAASPFVRDAIEAILKSA
uniref:Beta-adaptin appendage C-terminal subdomain domain-containing protein n=1 Tax=Bicosoecida sp. CB-2014 TaxID=1486930 RepID=A0A7S1CN35_9STRA